MPKTKEQNKQIKLERHNAILDNALYLFAIKGYNSVTIDEIANKCKCSHGLLYHYFGSKEELFNELMNSMVSKKIGKIFESINLNQKPKFVIIDYIDNILSAIKCEDDRYACSLYLVLNLRFQQQYMPKPKKYMQGITIFQTFLDNIEKGKEEGVVYDVSTKEMMVALLSLLKGLSFNRINFGYKKFICPRTEIITKMIIKS